MLRRGSRTASSAKRKSTSCTKVAATQVAEDWTKTQWLKGCSSFVSTVDGFGKSSGCSLLRIHSRPPQKTSRDAWKSQERLYQSAYDTSCPKTAREYRRSQAWHCSDEHLISVVALDLCQHVCHAEGKRSKNTLEHCLVRNPPNIVC